MVSPIVVLQGEYAVVQNTPLKCSAPTACIVFTLYDRAKQIGVMANVDDYTDIRAIFNKVEATLRNTFDHTLTSKQFVGKVMGGNGETFPIQQRASVMQILTRLGLQIEEVELPSPRPEVTLSGSDGSLLFSTPNKSLEYLQLREYGTFNTLLDSNYSTLPGVEIPFFNLEQLFVKNPLFH